MEYPNLYYHARTKIPGVPHHFKAGNLAGGTDFVTTLDGGEGEYIAALDADMIPEPQWLRALVAHLINDDQLALVCLPQVCLHDPPLVFLNAH
jgi:cellulose synthase/poly-beta-1,6-N-acetylglucosamine synthase-like glycosyltransferase